MTAATRPRVPALDRRAWGALLLAWLPLAIGYPLATSFMAENRLSGFAYGLRTAAVGGLLVAAVWWFSGRLAWPDRPSPRFYVVHLAAALVYAVAWWLIAVVLSGIRSPEPVVSVIADWLRSPYLAWNLMFGMVAYGLVAGVSYALRAGERIRQQQIRTAEADALATRAQLTALQGQLNPHFLFNTLHSLTVLIRRDPALAEEALERLGELLRYALDHGSDEHVQLRDEWRFVENYLALERLRLGERLQLELSVDPEALARDVPPFCLQPLVENAIRHGLDPRPSGGTLSIRLVAESDRLILRVEDDGAGADLPEGALPDTTPGTGFGLRALAARLESWEEEPGEVRIETQPGRGFRAVVTVPSGPSESATKRAAPALAANPEGVS